MPPTGPVRRSSYGPRLCPSCHGQVHCCALVNRVAAQWHASEIAVNLTPVEPADASVIRLRIRPDGTWVVVPVHDGEFDPMGIPMRPREVLFLRAHVCPAPPRIWVDDDALATAGAS